jgi:hypothetical protein
MKRYNVVEDKHTVSFVQTPAFQGAYRMLLKEIPSLPEPPPVPKQQPLVSSPKRESPKKRKTLPPVASTIYKEETKEKTKTEKMFKRSCSKLRNLWASAEAPEDEREIFTSLYFGNYSKESMTIIMQEIARWSDIQKHLQEISRAIDTRENLLETMKSLVSKYNSGQNKSAVLREAKNITVSLRYATLETVEAIMRWRVCFRIGVSNHVDAI